MKKASRLLFCIFALVACFQLLGLEEAFCKDSVAEAGCQECMTCIGHQFAGLTNPVSFPAMILIDHSFLNYTFHKTEQPPHRFFRPPITR